MPTPTVAVAAAAVSDCQWAQDTLALDAQLDRQGIQTYPQEVVTGTGGLLPYYEASVRQWDAIRMEVARACASGDFGNCDLAQYEIAEGWYTHVAHERFQGANAWDETWKANYVRLYGIVAVLCGGNWPPIDRSQRVLPGQN